MIHHVQMKSSVDILDVSLLVFVCDRNLTASRYQVNRLRLSKLVIVNAKGQVNNAFDIILKCPGQIAMKVFIDTFHVLYLNLLPKHHFVEGPDKERIQEAAVKDGETNNSTDELEVFKVFRIDARVRIDLESVIVVSRVFEKAIKRIKHFM